MGIPRTLNLHLIWRSRATLEPEVKMVISVDAFHLPLVYYWGGRDQNSRQPGICNNECVEIIRELPVFLYSGGKRLIL
jgi:hypothetical protein